MAYREVPFSLRTRLGQECMCKCGHVWVGNRLVWVDADSCGADMGSCKEVWGKCREVWADMRQLWNRCGVDIWHIWAGVGKMGQGWAICVGQVWDW